MDEGTRGEKDGLPQMEYTKDITKFFHEQLHSFL